MATIQCPGFSGTLRAGLFHKPERGAVLIISLIAMAIILLSTVALVRSFDNSLTMAGNLAFKRDLVNQGERGMTKAIALFNGASAALSTAASRQVDSLNNNYSASALATDSHGIPLVLINDAKFTARGLAGADIADSSSGVTTRYVIDRLCNKSGEFNTKDCMAVWVWPSMGGSGPRPEKEPQPVYRITVRVTGPRNTQSYLQTTITR